MKVFVCIVSDEDTDDNRQSRLDTQREERSHLLKVKSRHSDYKSTTPGKSPSNTTGTAVHPRIIVPIR